MVNGLIRFQALHGNTQSKGLISLNRLDFITLQANSPLLLPTMGKSKASKRKPEASGIDQEGSSRAKRYELKLFSIQPPGSIGVGLSISFGITTVFIFEFTLIIASLRIHLRIRIYVQLSFHFYTGGDGDICKSRDYLILVPASHIHNSKGRAFSCTVALEPSNPPFSNLVFANFL